MTAKAGALETYRGVVYPWHIDQIGQMNVQFYTARFDEATWHTATRRSVPLSPDILKPAQVHATP